MLVLPCDMEDLLHTCLFARQHNLPLYVLGKGSNVLIGDAGLRGLVVLIRHGVIALDADIGLVQADAGAMLPALARHAARAGLGGFEFLCDIPGTVGGAVAGNAGSGGPQGPSMRDVVAGVDVWDPQTGKVQSLPASALAFTYRGTALQQDGRVILSAQLRALHRDAPAAILARHREVIAHRRARQPGEPHTVGSVFRLGTHHQDAPKAPGRYIEQAGLKLARVGGAYVSDHHANWIINDGSATSAHVLALMQRIQETVLSLFGVELEPEVRIWA